MKRSEINAALKEMENMIREYRFSLPPFCDFTPEQWQELLEWDSLTCSAAGLRGHRSPS